jgi:hypothetical protein
MKKLALFALIALSAAPAAFAAGSNQLELNQSWFIANTPVQDLGKVIYNQPAGKNKVDLTYILQNAAPNTTYTVGYDIAFYGGACPATPLIFGVAPVIPCLPGNQGGTTTAIYVAGSVSTDSDGDASFHTNLLNLPKGDYRITFWVSPGENTLNPTATTSYLANPDISVISIQ